MLHNHCMISWFGLGQLKASTLIGWLKHLNTEKHETLPDNYVTILKVYVRSRVLSFDLNTTIPIRPEGQAAVSMEKKMNFKMLRCCLDYSIKLHDWKSLSEMHHGSCSYIFKCTVFYWCIVYQRTKLLIFLYWWLIRRFSWKWVTHCWLCISKGGNRSEGCLNVLYS